MNPLFVRQQRGELVPGAGRVPRLPGPAGEVGASTQSVRVLVAENPLLHRQQRGELVPGARRVPRLPSPVREVGASTQGARVLRAEQPLFVRQQRGELVPGAGRVPRLSGPAGEVGAGAQGVRVLVAQYPHPCIKHPLLEIPGGRVAPALPKIGGNSPHTAAVVRVGSLDMRQQRCEYRPGFRDPRVSWQGGFDHRRGSVLPRCGQLGGHLSNRDGLDQPVHRHRTVRGWANQRVAAQRGNRVLGCELVLQQWH